MNRGIPSQPIPEDSLDPLGNLGGAGRWWFFIVIN